ncbi:ubiquitin-like-specific protease 1A [Nymphaea colorata]|uniref:ubiquitin-like-specific protease 1A n=1 Tax=Nymphaea colorata TaxID=210225 RepID=UPI00129DE9C6|nr:ubiquitin-like-specific protease 1A [Nymphaea colorata]
MGALTDGRKRVLEASLVLCGGKWENEFCPYGSEIEILDRFMPAKKQKIQTLQLVSEPVRAAQALQPSVVTNTAVSRLAKLPPPPPLPREVQGPQRLLKYMGQANSSTSTTKTGKGSTRDDEGVTNSTSNATSGNMNRESWLLKYKRDALDFISSSRKDKAIIYESGQCSKSTIDRLNEMPSPPSAMETPLSATEAPVSAAEALDVEEYRRMVEDRVGESSHRLSDVMVSVRSPRVEEFSDTIVGTPQKSLVTSLVDLEDYSQPSPLKVQIGEAEDAKTPAASSSIHEQRWKRPAYKELQESIAKNRETSLRSLGDQIKVTEAKFAALGFIRKQTKPAKKDEFHKPFAPLTEEEEVEVSVALTGTNRRECLVFHERSNIEITRNILQCLLPGAWLNDEVINLYLELLKEREIRNPKQFLRCHFFNTFFYKKLIGGNGYDFKAVRRWTTQKKIGYALIECDKIFVPIHKEIHWCLAVINVREKKFQYLDSLGGRDSQVLKVLARYLSDEVKDKTDKVMDFTSWEKEFVVDLPEQQNGWDCGVFMIKYADFYSRGLELSFSQEDMPYFRRRTAKEILYLRAD